MKLGFGVEDRKIVGFWCNDDLFGIMIKVLD